MTRSCGVRIPEDDPTRTYIGISLENHLQKTLAAGIDQRSDKAINMSIKLVQKLYILDSELYLNSNDDVTQHTKYKNLKCMVGLFAYNPPACIDAIKEANKLGQIKVCGFDEQDALLQAIQEGHAHGTISQQPWEYGYESIKMLKSIYEGNQPKNKYFELPFLVVDQSNIKEFWEKKKEMAELGKQGW